MASTKNSKNGKGSYALYKAQGCREKNKALKAKRHEKRLAKFARRKEEGKTYEYKPIPFAKDTEKYIIEKNARRNKMEETWNRKTPLQRFISAMRKCKNEVEKIEKENKLKKKKVKVV